MTQQFASIGTKTISVFYESDRFIREVLRDNEYADIFNDLVVMDVGANIGAFSFWIYDRARVIYAIEPAQQNINCLRETIKQNDLSKIKPFCMGISGNGGMREFDTSSEASSGAWKMDLHPFPSTSLSLIQTKTISEFMRDEKIECVDILKIDVEGAEKEIFESESFKEVCLKIKNIIGEYHGYDPVEDLTLCGYEVRMIQDHSKFIARRI